MYYAKNGETGEIEFSGTDVAAVIQSAIDALPVTGGEIFIKRGTYVIGTTITIPNDCFLYGEGFGTILQFSGSGACIDMGGALQSEVGYLKIELSGNATIGIQLAGSAATSHCTIRRVRVEGTANNDGRTAFQVGGGSYGSAWVNRFYDIHAKNIQYGMRFQAGSVSYRPHGNSVFGVRCEDNTIAIDVEAGDENVFFNPVIGNCVITGMRISGHRCHVYGVRMETGLSVPAITLTANSNRCVIVPTLLYTGKPVEERISDAGVHNIIIFGYYTPGQPSARFPEGIIVLKHHGNQIT